MTGIDWLVVVSGVLLIGLVNWWFLGRWSGHKAGNDAHHH